MTWVARYERDDRGRITAEELYGPIVVVEDDSDGRLIEIAVTDQGNERDGSTDVELLSLATRIIACLNAPKKPVSGLKHAQYDAVLWGTGFMVDGHHVSADRVTVVQREAVPAELVALIAERLTSLMQED
jgi:hypothetical protein